MAYTMLYSIVKTWQVLRETMPLISGNNWLQLLQLRSGESTLMARIHMFLLTMPHSLCFNCKLTFLLTRFIGYNS